jgi:alkanesulfonate monooxygenase SsuD/methylene tetrahydromethanopterin reductase-like flavin-dependent oxidoreductase (luciferase family)
VVTPVNLQLAHWNLEHTAQQLRDPAAAAFQAGRQGEGVAAAVHRDGSVQAAEESAEEERLGAKKKREQSEKEGKRNRRSLTERDGEQAEEKAPPSGAEKGRLDFYA